jgi:hypothetical protein
MPKIRSFFPVDTLIFNGTSSDIQGGQPVKLAGMIRTGIAISASIFLAAPALAGGFYLYEVGGWARRSRCGSRRPTLKPKSGGISDMSRKERKDYEQL